MRRMTVRVLVSLTFLLIAVGGFSPLWAQEDSHDFRFVLDFGYRWRASFGGSRDLYRSQVDLGEGPKLQSGELIYAAPREGGALVDRFELRFNSWGGEPTSSVQLRASKANAYDLQFDYLHTDYFNSIPYFANPFFSTGDSLVSQQRYDLSQRVARFELKLRPGKMVSPYFGYQRTSRSGPANTTINAGGDEFKVGLDSDFSSDDLRAGVEIKKKSFFLLLEQGARWFRDYSSFEASGFQEGNSSRPIIRRDIFLTDYRATTRNRGLMPFSTAIAVYQPHRSVTLRGRFSYGIADLNSEFKDGTEGQFYQASRRFFYESGFLTALGGAKRPSLNGDFSFEWSPWDRFRLIERFTTRRLHTSGGVGLQNGFSEITPVLGGTGPVKDPQSVVNYWDTFQSVDVDTQELQGWFYFTPKVVLRLGHRYQSKTYKSAALGREIGNGEIPTSDAPAEYAWDRNVYLAGLSWNFSLQNRIAIDYEYGDTDAAIYRTEPHNFDRLRIYGRFSPLTSLRFDGSFTLLDHNNNDFDLVSRTRDYAFQFTYSPSETLSISGTYERDYFNHAIPIVQPQDFQPVSSFYREQAHYGDVYFSIPLPLKARVNLGYSVWGTTGTFPLTYHRPMGILEIPLGEYLVAYGQWNYYGYNEKVSFQPQDYRANLVLVGFRFTLDKAFAATP